MWGGALVGAQHRRCVWGILWEGLGDCPERRRLRPDSRGPDLVHPPAPRGTTLHPRGPSLASSSPSLPSPRPFLIYLSRHGAARAPTPSGLSAPAPPLSLPPHLKPPAPRWAPPCGNCPWRRRDVRPQGPQRPGRAAVGSPHSAPTAPLAAPSQSRRPSPPAPLRGRGPAGSRAAEGGAGSVREAARRSASVGSALYYTRERWRGPALTHPESIPLLPRSARVTTALSCLASPACTLQQRDLGSSLRPYSS